MKKTIIFAIALIALSIVGCNPGNSADFSKAPVQTGGTEQGEWRNTKGTMLSLNSGGFVYTKQGVGTTRGTYTMSGNTITLTSDGSAPATAEWPDKSGPLSVGGEQLTKTD
jgi:uncharacterized lipoprotein NlpE involved in copper resistance